MTEQYTHIPVLLNEVVKGLKLRTGGIYVDATFGNGGYSEAFLLAADCKVWAIDRDPQVINRAHELQYRYPGRFRFIPGLFSQLDRLLSINNISKIDGIAFDLGVSSRQLDDPERGFSFRHDGKLDMRMGMDGISAADIINHWDEKQLLDLLINYGEEPNAKRITKAIVIARKKAPITRTKQLSSLIQDTITFRTSHKIDPATQTFQALRIATNNEINELENALIMAEKLLNPLGRLAVVSFHSLEDRLVKNFLRSRSLPPSNKSRYYPQHENLDFHPTFRLVRGHAITPSLNELSMNRRSRSAKLRLAERTEFEKSREN